jgi:hypothetical protein
MRILAQMRFNGEGDCDKMGYYLKNNFIQKKHEKYQMFRMC